MKTETRMIAEDLKNAGFPVSEYGAAIRVSPFTNRKVTRMEIEAALFEAGYEEGMFRIAPAMIGGYTVIAEVG